MPDNKEENNNIGIQSPERQMASAPAMQPPAAAKEQDIYPERLNGKSLAEVEKDDLPMSAGEKFYIVVQQIGGKGLILSSTAAIGFMARYGPLSFGPVPNVFKRIQLFLNKHMVEPAEKHGDTVHRIAGAFANTMTISWGGVMFAPVIKWMENNRENIANWYNKKWGKPGDVEIAHKQLEDEPKQNWMDIFKGRIVTWTSIWLSFVAADMVLGKGKLFGKGDPTKYRFDQYEDAFGRWMAGWTKSGKDIWKKPLVEELSEEQQQHKWYQFGKITGLDFYATNAAIIIWSFFSRKSARTRQEKQAAKMKAEEDKILRDAADGINAAPREEIVSPSVDAIAAQAVQEEHVQDAAVARPFTENVTPRGKPEPASRAGNFAEALAAKESAESQPSLGA